MPTLCRYAMAYLQETASQCNGSLAFLYLEHLE